MSPELKKLIVNKLSTYSTEILKLIRLLEKDPMSILDIKNKFTELVIKKNIWQYVLFKLENHKQPIKQVINQLTHQQTINHTDPVIDEISKRVRLEVITDLSNYQQNPI